MVVSTSSAVSAGFQVPHAAYKHRRSGVSAFWNAEPESSQRSQRSNGRQDACVRTNAIKINIPAALASVLHLNSSRWSLQVIHPHDPAAAPATPPPTRPDSPAYSPKEDVSSAWRELHGHGNWSQLLDPLHPWLRREVIKYGEMAQATYDAFNANPLSEYCGSCLYGRDSLLSHLGLSKTGYKVTRYLYAMSRVELPRWLQRPLHAKDAAWSKDSNWMGFVSVSDDEETKRIGRRDIVVAWRGTVKAAEWAEDFMAAADRLPPQECCGGSEAGSRARVEHGFHSIYTSKREDTRYNKTSAREQVMAEVARLLKEYRNETVSVTFTGHSLGGALALLSARDVKATHPEIPVSAITFGAPMVGDAAFREEMENLGVKVLRIVNKMDAVPHLPGVPPYVHASGAELALHAGISPHLKKSWRPDLAGMHCLEVYLHLVDGWVSSSGKAGFRLTAKRDVTLVNKATGLLRDEYRIPPCWYSPEPYKGLVRNEQGRWVKLGRAAEDVPSPGTSLVPCS